MHSSYFEPGSRLVADPPAARLMRPLWTALPVSAEALHAVCTPKFGRKALSNPPVNLLYLPVRGRWQRHCRARREHLH